MKRETFRALARRLRRPSGSERHREDVGGMWDELGRLQFDFLIARGLRPEHRLLDLGCGSLRGGVHFIGFLEPGHYYGVDKDSQLLEAGREIELVRYGVQDRSPHLLVVGDFDLSAIAPDIRFEFVLAQSLFTQLLPEQIEACVACVLPRLADAGVFFSTFWESGQNDYGMPCPSRTNERTRARYPLSLFHDVARRTGATLEYVGDWGHPRHQKMLAFRRG